MIAFRGLALATLMVTAFAVTVLSLPVGSGLLTPAFGQAAAVPAGPQAPAENKLNNKNNESFTAVLDVSAVAVIKLFVLALLLESGLAVLFHWKPYLTFFNGRGMNALIAVAVAWVLVKQLEVDTVSQLIRAYTGSGPVNPGIGQFITALVLAGGSSGVHRILTALEYRQSVAEIEASNSPAVNAAWIAVRVNRRNATGPIFVTVEPTSGGQGSAPPTAVLQGVVALIERRSFGRRLRDCFVRDFNRFPQSGGYVVTPGQSYVISVIASDAVGKAIANPLDKTYVFADRAIVDFNVTL